MIVGRTGWGWRPFITMRDLARLEDVTVADRADAADGEESLPR